VTVRSGLALHPVHGAGRDHFSGLSVEGAAGHLPGATLDAVTVLRDQLAGVVCAVSVQSRFSPSG
jgi:hypothetical protein